MTSRELAGKLGAMGSEARAAAGVLVGCCWVALAGAVFLLGALAAYGGSPLAWAFYLAAVGALVLGFIVMADRAGTRLLPVAVGLAALLATMAAVLLVVLSPSDGARPALVVALAGAVVTWLGSGFSCATRHPSPRGAAPRAGWWWGARPEGGPPR